MSWVKLRRSFLYVEFLTPRCAKSIISKFEITKGTLEMIEKSSNTSKFQMQNREQIKILKYE